MGDNNPWRGSETEVSAEALVLQVAEQNIRRDSVFGTKCKSGEMVGCAGTHTRAGAVKVALS